MKNPMKILAVVNLTLLVGLIIFILVAKARTESGEKVGYFLNNEADASTTPSTTPAVTTQTS